MRLAAILLTTAGLAACRGQKPAASLHERPRPNVLLLTIDTLRADHLGAYGYHRATSPHIDALARSATLFEHAFSYWPKTRGSFTMIHTGRFPSQNGFDAAAFPLLASFNPTLASLLKDAGYETVAAVDNPNVAAALGYAKGFDRYLETWQQPELRTEMDRTRAITEEGKRVVRAARGARPLFLWLHYVNPHAPYSPPAPFDTRFLDAAANAGPELRLRPGFHGGIPRTLFVSGHRQLGWYVAQYDGEIAAVDEQIGRVLGALHASALAANTVVVLTSDHGESLGEHDYYFDHGEDLFDGTLAVPLIVAVPEGVGRHSSALAWSLDLLPTILEAAGVPRPEGLPGQSLVGQVEGHHAATHERLFAQNEEGLVAAWNAAYKIVAAPGAGGATSYALYDRGEDPLETRDVSVGAPAVLRSWHNELQAFLQARDGEWGLTHRATAALPGAPRLSPEACERLRALGYVAECS